MDNNEAEKILNNSDLRKLSYTENLAVLNYQISDIRGDIKGLLDSQESQWKTIGKHGERIKAVETKQTIWAGVQSLFAVFVSAVAGIAAYFGARK